MNQAKNGARNKEYWPSGGKDDLNIHLQPDRSNTDDNDLTSDTTWLTTTEDKAHALWPPRASQRLTYRELTERVIH